MITERAYAEDLRIATRRPPKVRDLRYDESTSELKWDGPVSGIPYTHFLIRFEDDNKKPAFCLSKESRSLFAPRVASVSICTYNQVSRIEGDRSHVVINSGLWTGATSSTFGPVLSWDLYYVLTANLTITTTAAAAPNRRLCIWVMAHATTEYEIAFDPAVFGDNSNKHLDPTKMLFMQFAGRFGSTKWWPITQAVQLDPTI